MTENDALRLLRAFAPLKLNTKIDRQSARYHALFLWNLFALWHERGRGFTDSFTELQLPETWARLASVFEGRVKLNQNEEKLDTLQLAGALAFLVPELRLRMQMAIRGKLVGIQYLIQKSDDELTFVPAFLALQGMALCANKQGIFTPDRITRLLEKAEAYEEAGPAIEHLCAWLRASLKRVGKQRGRRMR